MKKLICFALLCCSSLAAHASIQPASPYTQSIPGGITINNPSVATMMCKYDLVNMAMTFWFYYGTATVVAGQTTAFTADQNVSVVFIRVDLVASTYTTNAPGAGSDVTGVISGSLTPAELAALLAIMNGASTAAQIQDMAESFAFNHNLFGTGATYYPW